MRNTKKKFLKAKDSSDIVQTKPTATQLAGYKAAISAMKYNVQRYQFRVKAPKVVSEKSFRDYVSRLQHFKDSVAEYKPK
jgi:hypothetical protein